MRRHNYSPDSIHNRSISRRKTIVDSAIVRILQSQDATPQDASGDFESVRGTYEENAFVKDMNAAIADLKTHIKAFEQSLSNA